MEFKNIDSFNPRECISGKIRRINRLTSAIFRKHLATHDITESQLSVLFILTKAGSKTQKELTDFMKLEKSTLNRNLKRLFDKGYIQKENFPKIEMTEQGMIFVDNIIPEWERAMKEIRSIIEQDGEESLNIIIDKFN